MNSNLNFKSQGYCFLQKQIPELLIHSVKKSIEPIVTGEQKCLLPQWTQVNVGDPSALQRLMLVHMLNPMVYQLVTYEPLARCVANLIGARKLTLWASQLYYKPPGICKNGHVGFHRDSQHTSYFNSGVINVWVPLHKMESIHGPLTYVAGSHNWPRYSSDVGAECKDIEKQRSEIRSKFPENNWLETKAELEVGDVAVHHIDCIHGSDTNQSSVGRYAIAFGLLTDSFTINKSCDDHGYAQLLSNPEICPVVYRENQC